MKECKNYLQYLTQTDNQHSQIKACKNKLCNSKINKQSFIKDFFKVIGKEKKKKAKEQE